MIYTYSTLDDGYVLLLQDQRIPADMILLRTTERNGSCFIRTDQLDGETDWKLRMAIPSTQSLPSDQVHIAIHGANCTCLALCVCMCVL